MRFTSDFNNDVSALGIFQGKGICHCAICIHYLFSCIFVYIANIVFSFESCKSIKEKAPNDCSLGTLQLVSSHNT